ncbi:glycosyltransferase family 2 protein, partial [Streptococcus pneumoniae]|nr:glycosyltransferase family 2 protein [Streptococcus pneumoniae]
MTSCLYIHRALYNYRVHSESMVGKVRTERQLMDDVEIRLGRIPFLIGRGIDSTPYIAEIKRLIQWRLDTKSDVEEGESNALCMYREILRNL